MLKNVPAGKDIPNDINVVIEIPANNEPVKYEFDKDSSMLVVDRFMTATMQYPCNYGFIPNTLFDDGDPIDVLVLTPTPLKAGSIIRCRPVGMLNMTDDGGYDAKVIAVPVSKLTKIYDNVKNIDDLPKLLIQQIQHFFEHYKDLEPNKWVKIEGWTDIEEAKKAILSSVEAYKD